MLHLDSLAGRLVTVGDEQGLRLLFLIPSLWAGYLFVLFVYRLYFHPLASFPGPRVAAMTYSYEFWFDVVRWGRYTHEIKRLHQIYGMWNIVSLVAMSF